MEVKWKTSDTHIRAYIFTKHKHVKRRKYVCRHGEGCEGDGEMGKGIR